MYDVLSVLSAMGMAYKDGKNVIFTGHNPVETSSHNGELEQLEVSLTDRFHFSGVHLFSNRCTDDVKIW